jgi:hypothetical protein
MSIAMSAVYGAGVTIRRVGNRQLESLVGQSPHVFEAVNVEYFAFWFHFVNIFY